ncbi:TIGR03619 family F420-dependent LLM class oxidoreductase [Mycolicibacterium sp. XJ1819]
MKFHVLMPGCAQTPAITQPWEKSIPGSEVLRIARAIDDFGYDGVLIAEHFIIGSDHVESTGTHFVDATTAKSVIAGATQNIQVNSMVTLLPLRNPVVLAKSLCTLDWLSGGRAALTVGVGWQEAEYAALGVDWKQRGKIADEYLAAMVELWRSDTPTFDGQFVSFSDIAFEPKPMRQRNLPIWIGGDAAPALRRAARFGDGWAPWLTQPGELGEKIDRIKSDPNFNERPFTVFYSLMSLRIGFASGHHVALDAPEAGAGTEAQRIIDECGELAALGVTDTWIPPAQVGSVDEYIDHLRWVAEAVIPAARSL